MRPRSGKYNAKRTNGFASKHEADIVAKLEALQRAGNIRGLVLQHRIKLIEGRGKVRPIYYVADASFFEGDKWVVMDAKGFRTPEYKLKRKLLYLLHDIEIQEV